MLPSRHIIFGAIFSFVLWLVFPSINWLAASIIFLSSVLIDVDHYLYYVYRTGNWSLKKAHGWYFLNLDKFWKMSKEERDKYHHGICFLHGIEAILVLAALLLFLNNLFFISLLIFVIIGFIFHQAIDAIEIYMKNHKFDKIISFFYSVHNSKNKKLIQDM